MLLAAVLVVCVASSADARRRHHGYYGYGERSQSTLDDWRRARDTQGQGQGRGQAQGQDQGQNQRQDQAQDQRQDQRQDRLQDRRDYRARERGDAALRSGRGGPFAAVVEKLVRGCGAQGAEFENWPFDAIAQIVGADEKERNALAALRESAKAAAQRLAADCPQDVPAAPSARLEAVEQGIDAALAAFDQVQPALATFYGALDDEQKARLYRDMAAPAATARETRPRREAQDDQRAPREYGSRRDRWRAYAAAREAPARATAPRPAAAPPWSATCEEFAAVLRNWPVREIERDVRLSSTQRVAFYELVTSSLKAADTLASACPAETEAACRRARGHRRDPPRARALLRGARPGAEGEIRGDELGGSLHLRTRCAASPCLQGEGNSRQHSSEALRAPAALLFCRAEQSRFFLGFARIIEDLMFAKNSVEKSQNW